MESTHCHLCYSPMRAAAQFCMHCGEPRRRRAQLASHWGRNVLAVIGAMSVVVGVIWTITAIVDLPSQTAIAPEPAEAVATPVALMAPIAIATPNDDSEYFNSVRGELAIMAEKERALAPLLAHPKPYDQAWTQQVGELLAIYPAVHEEAGSLTPPQEWEEWNEKYELVLRAYTEAADKLAYGIDQSDADFIDDAANEFVGANQAIAALAKEIPQSND